MQILAGLRRIKEVSQQVANENQNNATPLSNTMELPGHTTARVGLKGTEGDKPTSEGLHTV